MQPREDRDPCRLGIVIVHRFGPCSVPGAPCVYRRRVGGAPGRAPGPSAVVAAASADRAARRNYPRSADARFRRYRNRSISRKLDGFLRYRRVYPLNPCHPARGARPRHEPGRHAFMALTRQTEGSRVVGRSEVGARAVPGRPGGPSGRGARPSRRSDVPSRRQNAERCGTAISPRVRPSRTHAAAPISPCTPITFPETACSFALWGARLPVRARRVLEAGTSTAPVRGI